MEASFIEVTKVYITEQEDGILNTTKRMIYIYEGNERHDIYLMGKRGTPIMVAMIKEKEHDREPVSAQTG